jgi:hypothetical protein
LDRGASEVNTARVRRIRHEKEKEKEKEKEDRQKLTKNELATREMKKIAI